MTKSEIHAVMTGGFATIAGLFSCFKRIFEWQISLNVVWIGSVLAAYISFGIDAANLLSASVMSAPAALSFSKLFYPETEKSQTKTSDIKVPKGLDNK
jgi:pyrimidine nucleoside transport protein